ncbi:unnamed protein product [Ixodes persulcatus]
MKFCSLRVAFQHDLPPDMVVEEDAGHSQVYDPPDAVGNVGIFEKNAADYLAGYCIYRASAKVGQCPQCLRLMTVEKNLIPELMLLYFKKYDPTFIAQGLKWPSETMVAVVEQGAVIFNNEIADHLCEPRLYSKLCSFLDKERFGMLSCLEHKDSAVQTLSRVLFTVLIRTKLKEINASFKKPASTRHMRPALHQ